MADDDDLTPADLFGTILAHGNEIKVITAQRLRELGVAVDPDWDQDFLCLAFLGQMFGVTMPHPSMEMVPVGVTRALLTGQNAATVAAILIIYAEEIVGKTTFTSMLDQEIARVRQHKTEGAQ